MDTAADVLNRHNRGDVLALNSGPTYLEHAVVRGWIGRETAEPLDVREVAGRGSILKECGTYCILGQTKYHTYLTDTIAYQQNQKSSKGYRGASHLRFPTPLPLHPH